ncbi:flagellar hook-length control protein FliK [Dyella sp. KRB-257]|uniref:flagellar hook-length control protein FliK n=1 Tax=Dyella sp. KRB-257 TaxID=3400915 RepID=UPI003C0607D2
MPATAVLPATPTLVPTAPAPAEPRGPTDAGRAFDSHLDAARQQHADDTRADTTPDRGSAQQPASRDARTEHSRPDAGSDATASASTSLVDTATVAVPVPNAAAQADPSASAVDASAKSKADAPAPDAISVASAMLALLGQVLPANASVAAGDAAKAMTASVLKAPSGQPATALPTAAMADAFATLTDAAAGHGAATVVPSGKTTTAGAAALADLFAAGASKAAMHKGADDPGMQELATLLGAAPQATANTGVMPPHALHIASPAGSPAFAQELGQQVAWLGNQDIKQAKIRLHPEELGQVDVSVRMQHGGQVDVTFAAQHPAAVHALQQTLPQLDALLAQHGLSLGQAQVGQQSAGGDGSRNGHSSFGSDGVDTGGDEPIAAPVTVSALGLLDTFA